MLGSSRIAAVVPAYNEERLIGATLASIPPFVDEVLVIDDGSRDATADVATALGDARVHVVRHARNQGVGAALKTGYEHAFERGADVVVVMAGDAQMHPGDLPALLAPVLEGDADYAKGDRLSHPEARSRMPRARFVGNHVLSWLTRVCTGLPVRDSQCGYTVMSRRVLARVRLEAMWQGYGYPNDLLARLALGECRVRDVVVRPVYASETSGIGLRHALVVIPLVLMRALGRRLSHRAALREAERALPLPRA